MNKLEVMLKINSVLDYASQTDNAWLFKQIEFVKTELDEYFNNIDFLWELQKKEDEKSNRN